MKKLYGVIIALMIALNCVNVFACDACQKGKKKKKHKTSYSHTISQAPAKTLPSVKPVEAAPVNHTYIEPLQVVNNPKAFLNKPVYIKAKFDKFSTLGLDYAPAMRSAADYITFLVQRNDVTDHDIPLSEAKFFLKRSYAEKFIDLETNDIIQIDGKVFSNALGDVWIDVDKIEIKEKVKKSDNK